MAKEIEYAVREAFEMNLSTEQGIKFIMRVSNCSREVAKKEMQQYKSAMSAHYEATNFVTS
tara:strand:+ start:48 stop:230 length:183 start_codon:yes stop_codon:yes gene_type:complete